MTALSDLLNDARADINVDQRVEAARKAGHRINRATVYKTLNGDHAKSPNEATLQALAFIFGIDVRDLRQAVSKPRGELGPWEPPAEANRLNQEQRDALDLLIKAIVRGKGGGAHGDGAAPTSGPAFGPDNLAALRPSVQVRDDLGDGRKVARKARSGRPSRAQQERAELEAVGEENQEGDQGQS